MIPEIKKSAQFVIFSVFALRVVSGQCKWNENLHSANWEKKVSEITTKEGEVKFFTNIFFGRHTHTYFPGIVGQLQNSNPSVIHVSATMSPVCHPCLPISHFSCHSSSHGEIYDQTNAIKALEKNTEHQYIIDALA